MSDDNPFDEHPAGGSVPTDFGYNPDAADAAEADGEASVEPQEAPEDEAGADVPEAEPDGAEATEDEAGSEPTDDTPTTDQVPPAED